MKMTMTLDEKHIILIGMNHNSASVEIREKYSLAPFCDPEAETFRTHFADICSEVFIVSTCNRVELLVMTNNIENESELIRRWAKLSAKEKGNEDELRAHVVTFIDDKAIEHLFAVASSLDSLVLGEPQILGQLKQAFKKSVDAKSVSTIFTRLLHKAFSVAKRVRTETSLASSAVSISYAAVELAKRIFDNIEERSVLIIGAGEMAELAALHLKHSGVENIFVANRTLANAEELAAKVSGKAIAFDEVKTYLEDVDIIVSSTGASHAILCAEDIKPILKARKYRPMFFIDIAMPRDIDPDVNGLDNVYLYDIDDLKEVVEENMANRRLEADKAWEIVKEETLSFNQWVYSLQCQPTIVALNNRTEEILRKEIERTLNKFPSIPVEVRDEFEMMMKSLTKKLNHDPLQYLKGHHCLETSIANTKRIFKV